MQIPWYMWKDVVIPILTVTNPNTDPTDIGSGSIPDPVTGKCYDMGVEIYTTLRTSLQMEGNVCQIGLGNYDTLLDKLIHTIGMMMEDQGYLPVGSVTG
jgi:hypothetical protein